MRLLLFVVAAAATTGALAKSLAGLSTSFCVLQGDGQVFCSGDNTQGNLGVGSTGKNIQYPLQMLYVTKAKDVSAGESHVCIVEEATGQAKCSGFNHYHNLLGDGTNTDSSVLVPVIGLESGVKELFCGPQSSCAVLAQGGGVRCWGYNYLGALADGTRTTPKHAVAVKGFENNAGVVAVGMGDGHNCFLTSLGKLWCAGQNQYGQLGNGTKSTSVATVPVAVQGLASSKTFVSVACGETHTCASTAAGEMLCWGDAYYGQLGQGQSTTAQPMPQVVVGLTSGVRSVWVGHRASFAIMNDGTAMAFGGNIDGVLGTGNSTNMRVPVVFAAASGGATNIKEIRGGYTTTCIMKQDDTVHCIGGNSRGQMGSGTTTGSTTALVPRLTLAQLPPTPPLTKIPTRAPTHAPTSRAPTTRSPTMTPTKKPTGQPTVPPTVPPTRSPTGEPTLAPSTAPTVSPTPAPSHSPSKPTKRPTRRPSRAGEVIENDEASTAPSSAAVAISAKSNVLATSLAVALLALNY